MDGTIVEWYGGQEHATPGYEKKEINRLICDAQKTHKPFDAVIVTNADRWSRDNSKSQEGLNVFKEHGICFFIGTSEHDLSNPTHRFILGVFAEVGQFYAANQRQKSMQARIHRAERGIPTSGRIPYGRIFDRQTGQWSIDKGKQDVIMQVAKRYLRGEKMPELAEEIGMNHSALHKILTKRCGDSWDNKFNCDDLKIHKTVQFKIPPLLPESMIQGIQKRAQANRTFEHGKTKYNYLLARVIFCKHCGYAMFGQTNHNGLSYFRHAHTNRHRKCTGFKKWVRAELLADLVLRQLFECFGNPQAVQKAIEAATPNLQKIEEYRKRIESIDTILDKNDTGRKRIIGLVSKGLINETHSERELLQLNMKDEKLTAEKQQLLANIGNQTSLDKIKKVSKNISQQIRLVAKQPFEKMTDEEKQYLIRTVFSGKRPDGKRMGIDIEWSGKELRFDIHGHLIEQMGLSIDGLKKSALLEEPISGWTIAQNNDLCTKSALYLQAQAHP